jgi:hypothetical protein
VDDGARLNYTTVGQYTGTHARINAYREHERRQREREFTPCWDARALLRRQLDRDRHALNACSLGFKMLTSKDPQDRWTTMSDTAANLLGEFSSQAKPFPAAHGDLDD